MTIKLTNEQLNVALNPFGFSDKTKAFKYFRGGDNNSFKQFYKAIEETKLFDSERTFILALILLNYNLNGSYPNFGGNLYHRATGILTKDIEKRTKGLKAFNSALKPATYNKWLAAYNSYEKVLTEKENNILGYNKPEVNTTVETIKVSNVEVTVKTIKPEYTELTVKEIEALLGYKIRIIG